MAPARPVPTIRVTERPASAISVRSSASVRSPAAPKITSMHAQIEMGSGSWCSTEPHQLADDQQAAALAHCGAARLEDLRRLCVVHPDHGVFEEVGVGASRQVGQKVATDDLAAALDPCRPQHGRGLGDDVGEIAHDAPLLRICLQDAGQQGSTSTTTPRAPKS